MASTAAVSDLVIRPFAHLDEYEACTEFQEDIWGQGFNERVSAAILMVANRIGGLSAGAFDPDGVLQGFVFGLTGIEDEELIHWSDMLAVRAGRRDEGLGTRLKHYQRDVLLARGVRRMRWTFDPLQSRNAYVNLRKLGIVTDEYVQDMYGDTGSPLHQGVGTDRLVAFWEMDSPRTEKRIRGEEPLLDDSLVEVLPRVFPTKGSGPFPIPGSAVLNLDDPALLLSIPSNVDKVVETDPELAVRWRGVTRAAFQHYLPQGYQVTEFIPGDQVSHYLLTRTR